MTTSEFQALTRKIKEEEAEQARISGAIEQAEKTLLEEFELSPDRVDAEIAELEESLDALKEKSEAAEEALRGIVPASWGI